MKHKHYDLIVAWANGAEIEIKLQGESVWTGYHKDTYPSWCLSHEYRVKPKPPVVRYAVAPRPAVDGLNKNGFQSFLLQYTSIQTPLDNVKFTFDGETGVLLSVEKL